MSAGAPWSVKGIDPKAREVAKDLARRSGMTLGEWLNHVILEDDIPEEIATEAEFGGRPRRFAAEPPRLRVLTNPTAAATPELARISLALDRITDRIETSETRTGLAVSGVEHSVRQALARIEATEREQVAVAARLERALDESGAQHERHAERLRRLEEAAGPRSPEALRLLETRLASLEPVTIVEDVLERLGDRLAMAEARTSAAISALRGSLGQLDQRLVGVERLGGGTGEARFESLAEILSHRVEAVRAEVAEKLQAAAGGSVEARLAEMAEHIAAAERRSTQAVEELGRQVLTMAEAVSRKLADVDQRSADAIDQVGGEVSRIAGAVELRLARGEQAQAEGFERLRAEFSWRSHPEPAAEPSPAPVAEVPPAPVIEAAPPRPAAARHVAAAAGPAAWLAGVQKPAEPAEPRSFEEQAQALERAFQLEPEEQPPWLAAALLGPPPEPEPETSPAFGPELFSRAEPDPGSAGETVDAPWRRLDLDVPETEVPETFAPIPEDEELFEAEAQPAARSAAGPELSTREVIDRARAAARSAQRSRPAAELRAKVNRGSASGRLFSGFRGKPARQGSALQTALMVAGGAAFLSVGAAGLTLMQGPREAQEATAVTPIAPQPRAAVALAPAGFAPQPTDAAPPVAAPVFEQVRADVEAGAPGALAKLIALAEADHPQAQRYLGQLYDTGKAGLPRDPVQARRFTLLAAENGDPDGMHNLGIAYFRGVGGPRDATGAAQWFRKAAVAGVTESQYNLGVLYQTGDGVPQDLAQARYWFGLAAAGGDGEARRALTQLTLAPPPASSAPRR